MKSPAITETVGLVARIGAALNAAASTTDIDLAADLRLAVSDLVDRAEIHIRSRTMGSALAAAFSAAGKAGAGFESFDRVRGIALADAVSSRLAIAARTACVRFALIGMATALSDTTFRSREDAREAGQRVNASFGPAIEDAADAGDTTAYRDLVALHAAVTRDLSQRARQLPRMVTFEFARRLPSLVLSQKLYGAGGRADEVAAENRVIHPLFAPPKGRALSL